MNGDAAQRTSEDYAPDFENPAAEPAKKPSVKVPSENDAAAPESVSLDNFDPFSPSRQITSPRSIEICRVHCVLPETLFHKTYTEIKRSIASPKRRNDTEYVKLKYIECENKRQEMVRRLRILRRTLNRFDSRSTKSQGCHQQTRSDGLGHRSNQTISEDEEYAGSEEWKSILLAAMHKERVRVLAPSLIHEEITRSERVAKREAKIIIDQFIPNNRTLLALKTEPSESGKKMTFDGWKKLRPIIVPERIRHKSLCKAETLHPGMTLNEKKNWHRSFVADSEQAKIAGTTGKIRREIERAEKCQLRNFSLRRRKEVIKELRGERKLEQKTVVVQIQEGRRQKLLEKIAKNSERSWSIVRGREALQSLRQEIIRNARIYKHQVKCALEKERRRAIDSGELKTITYSKLAFGLDDEEDKSQGVSTTVSGKKSGKKLDEDWEVRGINEHARRAAKMRVKERHLLEKLNMYAQINLK